jgi:hypothetical protein
MFDIIEVDIESRKITMMGQEKTEANAEAIERMAITFSRLFRQANMPTATPTKTPDTKGPDFGPRHCSSVSIHSPHRSGQHRRIT